MPDADGEKDSAPKTLPRGVLTLVARVLTSEPQHRLPAGLLAATVALMLQFRSQHSTDFHAALQATKWPQTHRRTHWLQHLSLPLTALS
jgi:hypothetical protein